MQYTNFEIEKQDNIDNQPNDISVSSVAALTIVSVFGHIAANYFSGKSICFVPWIIKVISRNINS